MSLRGINQGTPKDTFVLLGIRNKQAKDKQLTLTAIVWSKVQFMTRAVAISRKGILVVKAMVRCFCLWQKRCTFGAMCAFGTLWIFLFLATAKIYLPSKTKPLRFAWAFRTFPSRFYITVYTMNITRTRHSVFPSFSFRYGVPLRYRSVKRDTC